MPRKKANARKPVKPKQRKIKVPMIQPVKPRAIDREHYETGWIVAAAEYREVRL